MLPLMNSDYLFAVQDNSLFMKSHTFMMEKLAVPGGLLEWMGCYLVQFFYYPWLGSGMLILLWWIAYILTIRTFNLKGVCTLLALVPVTALICSVVDLGYWLYYTNTSGYWFSQTLGYIATIVAVYGYFLLSKRNKYLATPYIILWVTLGYGLLGWWALLGTLVIGCCKDCHWINRLLALSCIAVVPWVAYYGHSQFRLEEAWYYGLPIFQKGDFTEWLLTVPFFVIGVATLLLGWLCAKEIKGRFMSVLFAVVIALLCIIIPLKSNVSDANFHAELRMYRAMDDSRWEDVVKEYQKRTASPTHQMVMMKNTALLHLGQLGERMYELGNAGCKPHSGSLAVRMSVTAGPMLYYQNGLANFAYRWSIENEVEHGLSVKLLKMLVRCAIWSEENELAEKYISMLKSTLFHRQWARERERMIYDVGTFRQSEEYKAIAPIVVQGEGMLDFDSGLCEEYIINNFAYLLACNIQQQEAAACYAMMLKDDELMKFQIANYYDMNPNGNIPKHIQEAVDILNKEHSADFQKFISDYQTAVGVGRKIVDVGKDMKARYAGSYWWYYYFYNDFNIY